MNDRQIYTALMLAGVIPFLCFITGIHWATQLYSPNVLPLNLFVGSNAVFLAVFVAWATSSLNWALATQLMAYPLLLAVDYQLFRKGLINNHYLGVRVIATGLACFSFLFILTSG